MKPIHFVKCCYCDSSFQAQHGYSYNGDPLCPKCYKRYFVCCQTCNLVMRPYESFISADGQTLCYGCYCNLYHIN